MDPSRDSLEGLVLWQPARGAGYRVNVDSLHLARFAARDGRPASHALDLGSGVGAVGLTLLREGGARRVTFVEKNATLVSLCSRNVVENAFSTAARAVEADVCEPTAIAVRAFADLVVANPPYMTTGSGRPARPEIRAAREGELLPFVACARALLAKRGRACFVYPAHESMRLFAALRGAGLEPKRARYVHAALDRQARVVLVEACPGKPGGLVVEAPLVETPLSADEPVNR